MVSKAIPAVGVPVLPPVLLESVVSLGPLLLLLSALVTTPVDVVDPEASVAGAVVAGSVVEEDVVVVSPEEPPSLDELDEHAHAASTANMAKRRPA